MRTVEPASAVPLIFGEFSLAGESGSESATTTRAGAAVSTVKLREAGVWSVLPAGSVARTWKLWGPSLREAVVSGLEQGAQEPESTRHSKLDPAWSESKVKVGVGSLVGPVGPVRMAVSGSAVSTVMLRVAGVWSVLPAGSVARTWKLWGPSLREAGAAGREQAAQELE